MPKVIKPMPTKPKNFNKGIPLIVLATMVSGAFLAYFVGFMTFWQQHPIHWLLAIVGGVIGWLTGRFIYRLRGETDIL